MGCSSCCYRQWCLRGGACNPGWVVDVVPLSRAVLLGLGDDGMLGGLNVGVAWGEPARDGCGLRGGQGDAALLEKLRLQEVRRSKGDLVLHEVVVFFAVAVDVGDDGEIGELGKEVGAIHLLVSGHVTIVPVGRWRRVSDGAACGR